MLLEQHKPAELCQPYSKWKILVHRGWQSRGGELCSQLCRARRALSKVDRVIKMGVILYLTLHRPAWLL